MTRFFTEFGDSKIRLIVYKTLYPLPYFKSEIEMQSRPVEKVVSYSVPICTRLICPSSDCN